MESSGRQLSKNTKYAIVHALLGKKVRYQPVSMRAQMRFLVAKSCKFYFSILEQFYRRL